MSIVFRVPFFMKPMAGTSPHVTFFPCRLSLLPPGGPSKCGVNFVRYPYCSGLPIVSPTTGMEEAGRLEKFAYAFSTMVFLCSSW